MNYAELFDSLLPETALVIGALLVLAVDLLFLKSKPHGWRVGVAAALGVVAVTAAGWETWHARFTLDLMITGEGWSIHFPWENDPFSTFGKLAILALSGLTLLLIGGTSRLKNPAEHVALTLFATAGFTLMVAADNLLVIFLALELASLSLYILTGFDKTRRESAEAALKYFLYGSVAAAFLLFGFSLIYGLTGEIALPAIAEKLKDTPPSPLLLTAFVMVFVGFGYKAAAAPFHLWAPDAYQGAPVTSAALVAAGSKVAGFALLTRVLSYLHHPDSLAQPFNSWTGLLVILATASLLLGNIAALAQNNVRRLLAYSAIAHAGVLLIATFVAAYYYGFSPSFDQEFAGIKLLNPAENALVYYLGTYALATLGAFGVIAVVEKVDGTCEKISDLDGLWKRSPLLTICLCVFILSLAGIPPLAGFFAKFTVFGNALIFIEKVGSLESWLTPALFWLVLLAIAMSAVALYYYLRLLKAAFIAPPEENATAPIRTPWPAAVALILAAGALIVLGVQPSLFGL